MEVAFVGVLFYALYEFFSIVREQYEYEREWFKEKEKRNGKQSNPRSSINAAKKT